MILVDILNDIHILKVGYFWNFLKLKDILKTFESLRIFLTQNTNGKDIFFKLFLEYYRYFLKLLKIQSCSFKWITKFSDILYNLVKNNNNK